VFVLTSTRQQYYEQAAKFLLQEGGEHGACRHPGIICELLWLWQFPSQKSVQFLQKTLVTQAGACLQCAVALHSARRAALGAAEATDSGSASGRNALRDAIQAWDVARLTQSFEEAAAFSPKDGASPENRGSQCLQGALCPHVEFMLQPGLLLLNSDDGQRLNAAFSCSLSSLVLGDLSISGAQQLPGLYLLCVHSSAAIRNWARGQVRALDAIEHPAPFEELHEVFDVLVGHCERLTMIRNGCEQAAPCLYVGDGKQCISATCGSVRALCHAVPGAGLLARLCLLLLSDNVATSLGESGEESPRDCAGATHCSGASGRGSSKCRSFGQRRCLGSRRQGCSRDGRVQ